MYIPKFCLDSGFFKTIFLCIEFLSKLTPQFDRVRNLTVSLLFFVKVKYHSFTIAIYYVIPA